MIIERLKAKPTRLIPSAMAMAAQIGNQTAAFAALPRPSRAPRRRRLRAVSASGRSTGDTPYAKLSAAPMAVGPPSHPTYDLRAVISLALAEDAGDRGIVRGLVSSVGCVLLLVWFGVVTEESCLLF